MRFGLFEATDGILGAGPLFGASNGAQPLTISLVEPFLRDSAPTRRRTSPHTSPKMRARASGVGRECPDLDAPRWARTARIFWTPDARLRSAAKGGHLRLNQAVPLRQRDLGGFGRHALEALVIEEAPLRDLLSDTDLHMLR
jgi:hypothetical protein